MYISKMWVSSNYNVDDILVFKLCNWFLEIIIKTWGTRAVTVLVVYMCSSLLMDYVIYLKLRREKTLAEQINKMTATFTQNDNFVHPGQFWVSFCEFAQLYTTVIVFSAWVRSRDPWANWSKLEHMQTNYLISSWEARKNH